MRISRRAGHVLRVHCGFVPGGTQKQSSHVIKLAFARSSAPVIANSAHRVRTRERPLIPANARLELPGFVSVGGFANRLLQDAQFRFFDTNPARKPGCMSHPSISRGPLYE